MKDKMEKRAFLVFFLFVGFVFIVGCLSSDFNANDKDVYKNESEAYENYAEESYVEDVNGKGNSVYKEDKYKEVSNLLDSEIKDDPFNNPSGPFYHNIYLAESDDLVNWKLSAEPIFLHGSVPHAVVFNGKIFLYYVDGTRQSKSGMIVAVSEDNAKTWKRFFTEFDTEGEYIDPHAVVLPDGKIRMYALLSESDDYLGRRKFVSAVSEDGIFFEVEGVVYKEKQITDPDVVAIGERWFMYYSTGPNLHLAVSNDGLNFTHERMVRENGAVSTTFQVDNRYYQYYCLNGGIMVAETFDGLNFYDIGTALSISGKFLCDPAPLRLGDRYLMFFKVW